MSTFPTSSSVYILGERIGCERTGAFVYEAVCSPVGTTVAIKRVDLETQRSLGQMQAEVAVMRRLSHPQLTPLQKSYSPVPISAGVPVLLPPEEDE